MEVHIFSVKELCQKIAGYLPPMSVLLLIKHRIFCPEFKLNIRELIIYRLVELGFTGLIAEDLLNFLKEYRSVMSGPFMLYTLTSPVNYPLEWVPDSIDIYSELIISLDEEYYPLSIYRSHIEYWLYENNFCTDYYELLSDDIQLLGYDPIPDIVNKTWTHSDMHTINEIIVNKRVAPIMDYISECIDFDRYKITYTGDTLKIFDIPSVM